MKDREEGFERKFVLDEEMRFRAMARRNRMFGMWAAEKLGKSGAEAEDYAKTVVHADFHEAGDDDVLRKVHGDFQAAGVAYGQAELRRVMDDLLPKAIEQVRNTQ